jgi:transposase
LDGERRATLKQVVLDGPDVEATGLSAWTLSELCREVEERWGVVPPLAHGQADAPARLVVAEGTAVAPEGGCGSARGVCKRGLQAALDDARAEHTDKRLTLWFMDEARFGQKGRVCHRWFTRGQRPPGLCDQRYSWTHLFAAVRPASGEGFALVLPEVSAKAMNEFLAQFAATLAEDEHAIMVLDRAGWHTAKRLVIPSNVTLVWLPPYSPQLNPVERVWLYLREKHWSHRLLDTADAIVDALCRAWNALAAERLRSLTSYPYLDQVKI